MYEKYSENLDKNRKLTRHVYCYLSQSAEE